MRSQPVLMVIFLGIFIILIDLYVYRGVSQLSHSLSSRIRMLVNVTYWSITGIALLWLAWLVLSAGNLSSQQLYRAFTVFFGFFLVIYLPKLFFTVFTLLQDITSLLAKGAGYMVDKSSKAGMTAERISRSDFLLRVGVIISAIPFISVLYGIIYGKYNFTLKKVVLSSTKLPPAFHGLKIVQISDLHLGSFRGDSSKIEEAIDLVNEQNPDLILFTGDMVNTLSTEMEGFISTLQRLKAPMGKFSILGNHDYGDYHHWDSSEEKKENLQNLVRMEEEAGFRLLRNESMVLDKKGQNIALIGVENWGLPPFPQYGDLHKAMKGVKDVDFKILMSHDPSHWDAVVRPESDIDLTLSGHTHGMQFAIRIPGWKWSPVKLKYPRWAGLYREGKQRLYVNIGLGFIAFPGRVGTPPEVTLFELKKG